MDERRIQTGPLNLFSDKKEVKDVHMTLIALIANLTEEQADTILNIIPNDAIRNSISARKVDSTRMAMIGKVTTLNSSDVSKVVEALKAFCSVTEFICPIIEKV